MTPLSRRIQIFAATISIIVTTNACSISYPTASDVINARNNRPLYQTYDDAIGYVEAARSDITSLRQQIDFAENASSAAILAGSVVALTAGVLRTKASSDTARIALMGAGTAFGLGTLLNPRQQIQVLDNGISALNCLEDRSRTVFIAIAPIEDLLRPLDQAIANLRQQIATQVASADKRADARKLYSAALVQRAAKAPSMVGLVQRITAGTDQIITETNTQLKRAEPDVNAVQRIAASINLAKSPTVLTSVGPPSPPPRGEMFAQKEVLLPGDRALDNAMTAVWNELPVLDAVAALQPPSADTLNSCKMAATTGVAMALSPATDAAPKKGAPWTITSTVAGFGSWEGPTPPDIKAAPLNTASKTFVFTTNSTNLTSPAYRFVVRSAIDDANAAAINVSIGK